MRDVAFHKSEVGVVCYFIEVGADEPGSAGEEDFHNILSAKSREFPSSQAPREVVHLSVLGAGIREATQEPKRSYVCCCYACSERPLSYGQCAKSREFPSSQAPREVLPRILLCAGISVLLISLGAGFREATQEPRRSYVPCMLGAGFREGGTTEAVLSGLHVKVCRIPRGRNDRSGLIRLAR